MFIFRSIPIIIFFSKSTSQSWNVNYLQMCLLVFMHIYTYLANDLSNITIGLPIFISNLMCRQSIRQTIEMQFDWLSEP